MTLKRVTVSCYNFLQARGDRFRFLKRIAKILAPLTAKGVRWATRIFLVNTWGQDIRHILQPWIQVGWWDADYPGKRVPIFDLGTPQKPKWNEEWWTQYESALDRVGYLGGYGHLVLGDYCSLKKPNELKYHDPIRSNIQRFPDWDEVKPDHDPAIPDSWYGQGMRPYWRAFWKRAIMEAQLILGQDFDVEIMNEVDVEGMPLQTLLDWHNWAVKTVIALGVPRERIIASASRGAAEIAATVGTFSCHGHARPDQVKAGLLRDPAFEDRDLDRRRHRRPRPRRHRRRQGPVLG